MPDNPTPRDTTPTLAELEGGYFLRTCRLFSGYLYRVVGGKVENYNKEQRQWLSSVMALTGLQAFIKQGDIRPMTPAEIAATWPELAPAAVPYPWAEVQDGK